MRSAVQLPIVALLLWSSSALQGAEWKIDPALAFRAGYTDNLRFTTEDEISTSDVAFSPSVVFSVATPTSGLSGNLSLELRRYEEDSDLDDGVIRVSLDSYHNMERSRVGLSVGFIKDTTLDSQLEQTGVAVERVNRYHVNVRPNWSYSLDERTRISASFGYSEISYRNTQDTASVDFRSSSGQVSLSRILGERTTASISLSRGDTKNENDVETTNTSLQAGASHQFSETLSGSLYAGARQTESEFSETSTIFIFSGNTIIGVIPLTEDVSTSNSGSNFSATLTKSFLRGETALNASRDITTDFNGQPIDVTRLQWTNRYGFTELLSGRLNLLFSSSEFAGDVGGSGNRDYYQIEPSLVWALKKFWSLSGTYRYRQQTLEDVNDDATENAAYLTLTYDWPRIAVSR